MNTLSVLIYLSSVSQSLNAFFTFIAIIFFIISVIFGIISIFNYFMAQEQLRYSSNREPSEIGISNTFRKFLLRFTLPLTFLCSILAIAIPDRQTILLIAASEYGERIMNSERVNALVDPSIQYLQSWLRNEVNKLQQEGTRR